MVIHVNKNLAYFRHSMVILVLFSYFRELIMNIHNNIVIFTNNRAINTALWLIR